MATKKNPLEATSIYTAALAEGLSASPGHGAAIWIAGAEDFDDGDDRVDRAAAAAGYVRHRGPAGDYLIPAPEGDEDDDLSDGDAEDRATQWDR